MDHILIQGKLKPFEGPKQWNGDKNVKFPGKLRSPFAPKEQKERERIISGKLRDDRFGDIGRRVDILHKYYFYKCKNKCIQKKS